MWVRCLIQSQALLYRFWDRRHRSSANTLPHSASWFLAVSLLKTFGDEVVSDKILGQRTEVRKEEKAGEEWRSDWEEPRSALILSAGVSRTCSYLLLHEDWNSTRWKLTKLFLALCPYKWRPALVALMRRWLSLACSYPNALLTILCSRISVWMQGTNQPHPPREVGGDTRESALHTHSAHCWEQDVWHNTGPSRSNMWDLIPVQ